MGHPLPRLVAAALSWVILWAANGEEHGIRVHHIWTGKISYSAIGFPKVSVSWSIKWTKTPYLLLCREPSIPTVTRVQPELSHCCQAVTSERDS